MNVARMKELLRAYAPAAIRPDWPGLWYAQAIFSEKTVGGPVVIFTGEKESALGWRDAIDLLDGWDPKRVVCAVNRPLSRVDTLLSGLDRVEQGEMFLGTRRRIS